MFHPLPFDGPDRGLNWLAVALAAGEDAPAHALVRVTGGGKTGPYAVAKPDADGGYVWVLSGEAAPAGAVGAAAPDGPVWALYDAADGAPAAGETWGAGAGTWKLRKGTGGWRVVGEADTELGIVPVVRAGGAAPTTTTTTTTTTAGPCAGSCQWTYSVASKTWTRTTSTCAAGCACLAPTWCPATDACADTACGRLAADAPPPSCTGTTTTAGACGTTTPSACAAGCVWYCHPVRGWMPRSNGCAGGCPCPRPASPCTVSECATEVMTPCQVPSYYCTGSCRWMWVSEEFGWEWVTGSCSSYGVSGCACDRPTAPGSRCGQEVSTPCYSPQGNNPCQTVTTAGPLYSCGGDCLWGSTDGAMWNQLVRPCVGAGCVCDRPLYAPAGTCSQAAGACVQGVPTTTTAAPPTTTTAGPLQWYCYDCTENPSYGFWGCAATAVMPAGCVLKSGPYSGDSAACVAACQPPTTTTAGPTTTAAPATTSTTTTTAGPPPTTSTTTAAPTTTTTAGPAVDYFCCQCAMGINKCSFDPINQCAGCTVTGPMSLALCNGTCVGRIGETTSGPTTTPPRCP